MCVLGFWSSTNHNSFHLEWDVCNCSWRIPVFSIDTSSIQTKFKIDILKKLFYKILLAYETMNYPQREVYFLVNPIYLEFGLNWIYVHRMKNLASPPIVVFLAHILDAIFRIERYPAAGASACTWSQGGWTVEINRRYQQIMHLDYLIM